MKPKKPKEDLTKTMDVPRAGRIYFGLSKNASYEAAKNGDIPTIKFGRKIRALIPAIERMLEQAGKGEPAA